MNLQSLQKEPIVWLSGDKLDASNLACCLRIGVQGESPVLGFDHSEETACLVGVTFDTQPITMQNATMFEAKASQVFASSAMLTRMLMELDFNEQKNQSKSILKLDEMLNCVTLHRLPGAYICQLSVHESNTSSMLLLQKTLAFCFAAIGNETITASSIISHNLGLIDVEQSISSLTLYSFAWLCSVVRTLGMNPFCIRLECLLQFNLETYLKREKAIRMIKKGTCIHDCKIADKSSKEFYYMLMFLCSIAAKRAEPMDRLLRFLENGRYIAAFQCYYEFFKKNPQQISMPFAASLQVKEALDRYFKKQFTREKSTVSRSETTTLLTMVDVFLSWLGKIVVASTMLQRERMLRCIVCFDQSVCEISCDDDSLHRKFVVTKYDTQQQVVNVQDKPEQFRRCRMSFFDLGEWLRYMVLLQLDKRNVHSKTEFYLNASPKLYNFGSPPNLTFQNDGIEYLTFFLLESEFVRATLHQTRPELRRIRDKMMVDEKLQAFVSTKPPFQNYIILCRELLDSVAAFYALKTIQAVPQN